MYRVIINIILVILLFVVSTFLFLIIVDLISFLCRFLISNIKFYLKQNKRERNRYTLDDITNGINNATTQNQIPNTTPRGSNVVVQTKSQTANTTFIPVFSINNIPSFTRLDAQKLVDLLNVKIQEIEKQFQEPNLPSDEVKLTILTLKFIAAECARML